MLAIGFTLIYGVAEVVNMTHGALFMLGAYIYWILTASEFHGLPLEPIQLHPGLAIIIAAILTAIAGMIIYKLTISPVVEDLIAVLVVTVGVVIILQETIIIEFSSKRWPVVSFTKGFTTFLGVKVTYSELLAFAVSLCIFTALWIFITKSKIGSTMRAVAQDREVAMLMGINTDRLYTLTMAMSASIAALAGVLITASTSGFAYPHMWDTPLYMSFAIVILGGLGSIKGTFIGAFIVGFAENAFIFIMSALGISGAEFLKGVVAVTVMVLVLLIRPKGLFGKRVEMED